MFVIKDRCVFIVFKMGESTIAIKSKLKRCQCIVHKQSRPRLYRLADMVWMARHRNWFQYFVSFVWFFSDHKANYARLVRTFPQHHRMVGSKSMLVIRRFQATEPEVEASQLIIKRVISIWQSYSEPRLA